MRLYFGYGRCARFPVRGDMESARLESPRSSAPRSPRPAERRRPARTESQSRRASPESWLERDDESNVDPIELDVSPLGNLPSADETQWVEWPERRMSDESEEEAPEPTPAASRSELDPVRAYLSDIGRHR